MGSCSYRLLLMELVPEIVTHMRRENTVYVHGRVRRSAVCKADSERDMLSDVRMCDW
jgi:hypothetical protein